MQMNKPENDNTEELEAQTENGERFGKFENAQSLLDAYNALEAEFTKRCQLISKLQTELNELRAAQARESEVAPAPTEQVGEKAAEQLVRSSADGIDANAVILAIEQDPEFAVVLAELPEVCDACIAKYKQRLLSYPVISPHGAPVIAPAKRPRTLADAKALADEMLK